MVKGSNPVRVILDSHLHISLMANAEPVADTIIITGLDVDPLKAEALNALPNVEVVQLPLKTVIRLFLWLLKTWHSVA